MKSYSEIYAAFAAEILPAVVAQYGKDDEPARNEAWNNYTDAECKDGEMTDTAYIFCPSFDDVPEHDDLADDIERILSDMGVTFSADAVAARGDGLMVDMARHFKCEINRTHGRVALPYKFYFSQGEAHTASPTLIDTLSCLLSDASGVDRTSFEDWCAEYDYDTDSRKAFAMYEACEATKTALESLFTQQEMADLQEMINEAGL